MTIERKRLTKPVNKAKLLDPRVRGAALHDNPVEHFKGRKRGPNKVNVLFKEALLMAPHLLGSNGQGKDGVVGWLKQQAIKYPETYLKMLVRFMTPTEVQMMSLSLQQNNLNAGDNSMPVDPTQQMAIAMEHFRGLIKTKSTKDLKAMMRGVLAVQQAIGVKGSTGAIVRIDGERDVARRNKRLEQLERLYGRQTPEDIIDAEATEVKTR